MAKDRFPEGDKQGGLSNCPIAASRGNLGFSGGGDAQVGQRTPGLMRWGDCWGAQGGWSSQDGAAEGRVWH